MRSLAGLLLRTVAFFSVLASVAFAAPITSGNGTYGGFGVSGSTANYTFGMFTQASPNQPAATNLSGGLLLGLNPKYGVSDLGINLASFGAEPGPIGLSSTFTITGQPIAGADAGQTAVFTIVGAAGVLNDNGNMTGDIQATLQLTGSSLTGLDFGPIGSLYHFILSY